MLRQIRKLTAVQLCNLCGINEVRHTKDKGKKMRFAGLAVVWVFLILMLVFYMAVLASAFVMIGFADIVPVYLYLVTSLVIFFFSIVKASGVLFQMNTYEVLISLPVSQTAIVASRFLTMYVTDLLLGLVVMLPGAVIYGINVHPRVTFYFYTLTGTVLLPFLPITLAAAVGAVITAVSARMRHKSMVQTVLTVLFLAVFFTANISFSANADRVMLSQAIVTEFLSSVTQQIKQLYPSALWFGEAAVSGSLSGFLKLFGVSAAAFVILIAVLQKYFVAICSALKGTTAKNDYKMQRLSKSSPVRALWGRELRRYFASSIYVTNTIVGYLLMALVPAMMLIVGQEKLSEMEAAMGIPHLIVKAMPFLLAFLGALMPTTCCSVSMEGKQWWIAKSLPVSSKMIFDSKILVNLTIAAPFYVIGVMLAMLAVRPTLTEGVWIMLIPAVYILFTAVAGITVNLALPVLTWENETRVVKQSASVAICMLLGTVSVLPPFGFLFVFGGAQDVVMLLTAAVLLVITAVLYRYNNEKQLTHIR